MDLAFQKASGLQTSPAEAKGQRVFEGGLHERRVKREQRTIWKKLCVKRRQVSKRFP